MRPSLPKVKRPQKLITAFLAMLTAAALLLPLPLVLNDSLSTPAQTRLLVVVLAVSATILINVILFLVGRSELRWQRQAEKLAELLRANEAVAQENVRLYEAQRARAEQLALLNKVSSLLTETLAPHEVQDAVVSAAGVLSDAHAITLHLLQEQWQLVRHVGMDAPPELPPRVAQSGSALVVSETAQDAPDWARANGVRAYALLPLLMNHQIIGMLGFYFHAPQPALPEQLDLLQAFALQAAQAISNARVYERTDKALEQRAEQLFVLAAMAQQLTIELDAFRIYEATLTYAMDATQAQRGAFLRFDGAGTPHCELARGYVVPPSASALWQGALAQHVGARLGYLAEDLQHSRDYRPPVATTRAVLAVPLVQGQALQGVIILENDVPRSFTQSDSHFVAQMAYQATIAIENHRLFRDVRETRDRLQVILNAMEEALILVDKAGIITLANPRVSLLSLAADALRGQPLRQLLAAGMPLAERLGFRDDAALLTLGTAEDSTAPSTTRYELVVGSATRTIERQLLPLHDEDDRLLGVLLVFYDKTQERELANAREAFTQMIVHDLRSPLTAVTTSLKLYGELIPPDVPHYATIERMTIASQRAIRKVLNRVDAILDIAKMESGSVQLERDYVDLRLLTENICHELAPIADDINVTITRSYDDALPPADVDSDKVERVLLNLIDNALKYSPNDSSVHVRITLDEAGWLRVAIADSGVGIPDEYKVKLFDRFTQVAGRASLRRGVGLGLNFCKLAIEAHGGKIWIEDNSAEGGGSIFVFTLPAATLPDAS